jgi:hypothetical protein
MVHVLQSRTAPAYLQTWALRMLACSCSTSCSARNLHPRHRSGSALVDTLVAPHMLACSRITSRSTAFWSFLSPSAAACSLWTNALAVDLTTVTCHRPERAARRRLGRPMSSRRMR